MGYNPAYDLDEAIQEERPALEGLYEAFIPWLQDAGLSQLAAHVASVCDYELDYGRKNAAQKARNAIPIVHAIQEIAYDRNPRCLLHGWALDALRASAYEIRWADPWRGRVDLEIEDALEELGQACAVLQVIHHPPEVMDPFLWETVARVGRMRRRLGPVSGIGDRYIGYYADTVKHAVMKQIRRAYPGRLPKGHTLRKTQDLVGQLAEIQERAHRNRRCDQEHLRLQGSRSTIEYGERSGTGHRVRRNGAEQVAPPPSGREAMALARTNYRRRLEKELAGAFRNIPDLNRRGAVVAGISDIEITDDLPAYSMSLRKGNRSTYGWVLRVSDRFLPSLRLSRSRIARGVLPVVERTIEEHGPGTRRVYAVWLTHQTDRPILEHGLIDYRYATPAEIHRARAHEPPPTRTQARRPTVPPTQSFEWDPAVGTALAAAKPWAPDPEPPATARVTASEVAAIRASVDARTRLSAAYPLPTTRIEKIQNLPRWGDALSVAWAE